jgi:hypothetical protein
MKQYFYCREVPVSKVKRAETQIHNISILITGEYCNASTSRITLEDWLPGSALLLLTDGGCNMGGIAQAFP